jgi:hypothetical protein
MSSPPGDSSLAPLDPADGVEVDAIVADTECTQAVALGATCDPTSTGAIRSPKSLQHHGGGGI